MVRNVVRYLDALMDVVIDLVKAENRKSGEHKDVGESQAPLKELTNLLLYIACAEDDVPVARMMISRAGADKDFVNGYEDSNSPLYATSMRGHEAIVEFLVREGADVNAHNEKGRTPLHAASMRGHEAIVKMLVRHKADVNAKDEKDRSPLIIALQRGHPELAKWLLTQRQNLNSRDDHGWTPLHAATFQGYTNIVKMLLDIGVDLDTKNDRGQTSLQIATTERYKDIVKILHRKKAENKNAKASMKDESIRTILQAKEGGEEDKPRKKRR